VNVIDYRLAGVDISAGNEAVSRIKQKVEKTFSKNVLSGLGGFGALYDLSEIIQHYQQPVMVQSIDGVGTKIMIARMMNRYDTIGIDLVSATVNDILVLGAKPLTLLDYIANEKLHPHIVDTIVSGMAQACCDHHISLVGGETAEMPGTYLSGEQDLVGVITGVVEKNKIVDGRFIQPDDVVLAFASSGLHTNGYSLARKLLFEKMLYSIETTLPELQRPLGEVLLEPHLNYTVPVQTLLNAGVNIKGMAHITGGGLLENSPRILPDHTALEITLNSWPNQPIFSLLQDIGHLDQREMYRTFNMGVGYVLILSRDEVNAAQKILNNMPQFQLYEIGKVIKGHKQIHLVK